MEEKWSWVRGEKENNALGTRRGYLRDETECSGFRGFMSQSNKLWIRAKYKECTNCSVIWS